MAKVILISRQLSRSATQLASALRAQQHKVSLISSRDQDFSSDSDIEILTPFRTWSWFEGIRFIPYLLTMRPQVIHLLLEDDQLSPAELFISSYASLNQSYVVTTSLLNIRKGLGRVNPVRYLIERSDIVTCPSVDTMAQLRGLNIRSSRQARGILPPVLSFKDEVMSETEWQKEIVVDEASVNLKSQLQSKPYIVLPFFQPRFDAHHAFFKRLVILANHYTVVLLGSSEHWSLKERKRFSTWMQQQGLGKDWILTGKLNPSEQHWLLENAQAFILAGLSLNPLEITEYYLRAIQARCTCILDSKQSSVHANYWRPEKNCWILPIENLTDSLHRLMKKDELKIDIDEDPVASIQRDMIDAPINDLSRLYNKALNQKSWRGV